MVIADLVFATRRILSSTCSVAVRFKEGSVAEIDSLSWFCSIHWICPPGSVACMYTRVRPRSLNKVLEALMIASKEFLTQHAHDILQQWRRIVISDDDDEQANIDDVVPPNQSLWDRREYVQRL